jgi:hypothetical protein
MKRLSTLLTVAIAAVLVLALGVAVPLAAAADEVLPHTGRVLISVEGDVALPAGEQADVIVVVGGAARISGQVNTIVVVDGSLEMTGARAESVISVRSPTTLGTGTVVLGDVRTLDAAVQQAAGSQVQGSVRDLAPEIAGIGAVLAPAAILLWLGFGLATLVAALALAGLAARQVRTAERLISLEPLKTFLVGLATAIVTPILGVLMIVTVVGAPLGFAILLGVLPAVAFAGYLVSAIWVGEWLLRRLPRGTAADRPYVGAVLGVIALAVLGLVPLLGAIASIFGFGAVVLLAWRTLTGSSTDAAGQPDQSTARAALPA